MKESEEKNNFKSQFKIDKNLVIGLIVGFILGAIIFSISSNGKISDYESQLSDYKSNDTKQSKEIEELRSKVKEAQPWFEMQEQEQKEKEEELAAKKKAEEEAQKAKEEQARREQEEKEKRGYDTGRTYNQLARTPDDYEGEKVKFSGKVLQVMEGSSDVQIRLAVNGDYDKVVYGTYDKTIVSSRILEDDYITIMGTSGGLLTYESTMGASITIPSISIDKIER